MSSQETDSYLGPEFIRDHKFCPMCGVQLWVFKTDVRGSVPEYKCEDCEAEFWQVIT